MVVVVAGVIVTFPHPGQIALLGTTNLVILLQQFCKADMQTLRPCPQRSKRYVLRRGRVLMPLFIFPINIAHTQTAFLRITFRKDAVLQFTFQKKILCRAQNSLPLGRCNKIAAPSNRIPHTAQQERGHLDGVLQELLRQRVLSRCPHPPTIMKMIKLKHLSD